MTDNTNIVLIILYIFLISLGLIFFFNITLRYIGHFSKIEVMFIFLVILIGLIFVINYLNFARGYADSRNAQRSADVQIIADTFDDYISEFGYGPDLTNLIPTCPSVRFIGKEANMVDLTSKFIENSLVAVPLDPAVGNEQNTGYTICVTTTKRIVINAPHAENDKIVTAKK